MSDWSTGAVGPHHRAVLCNGVVIAIAEDTVSASAIVRTMNQAPRDRHNLQALREKLKDIIEMCRDDSSAEDEGDIEGRGWKRGLLYVASELQGVLDGKSE